MIPIFEQAIGSHGVVVTHGRATCAAWVRIPWLLTFPYHDTKKVRGQQMLKMYIYDDAGRLRMILVSNKRTT